MNHNFNDKLRQVLLLFLILLISFFLAREFFIFLPGLMGGLTLYILTGDLYNKLVTNDNNVFKLMTDFSKPVENDGPPGTDPDVETTELTLLDRLAVT